MERFVLVETASCCRITCISTKRRDKVYILMVNSCVNFHAKLSRIAEISTKVTGGGYFVCSLMHVRKLSRPNHWNIQTALTTVRIQFFASARKWPKSILNWKRGSCECVATWGRPTTRRSFSALITSLRRHFWSRWTYPLLYYSVFLLLIHYFALCDLDLWPLTLNICKVAPADVTW